MKLACPQAHFPHQISIAAVAQWIEYWPPKPRVVGSIPASRTNRQFFNVSEHLKTRMFIGIAGFYLSHRISGGNMTYRQKSSRFDGI